MPKEPFYQGLTLAEQLRKFVDYHYDPKYRHISAFEAGLIERAQERIEVTLEIATQQARQDLQAVYESLMQMYETTLYGSSYGLAVQSFPSWRISEPADILISSGLISFAEDPTATQAQAAIAALLFSETSSPNLGGLQQQAVTSPVDDTQAGTVAVSASDPVKTSALFERYMAFVADVRVLEREVDAETLALVNRVLYLPTIVAENSWPEVKPLLDHFKIATSHGSPVLMFGGALYGTHNIVLAFIAGGSVIVLQSVQSVADGMAPGLRALGEKLTSSWPKPDAPTKTEKSKKAKKDKTK